jgi:DNA polymerase-1
MNNRSPRRDLILLVDGHALIHRAFHAVPPLSVRKTGEPTNAVFGFANTLLKAMGDLQPDYIAVAFDRSAPTFRHIAYDAYKAQRTRAPDELMVQFARVHELVDAFNIPSYELDKYEADDVLGTLAVQAVDCGLDVIILTGDADAFQLINENVRVLRPSRTFSETQLYDAAAVQERYGVRPDQIADLKGLTGDSSDNIPGVPGIGEKTAAKLLQTFGRVEDLVEGLDAVTPPRIQEILRAHADQALRSKDLATIRCDAPVTLDLASAHRSAYDRAQVVELFRELEFRSLIGRLPEGEAGRLGDRAARGAAEVADPAEALPAPAQNLELIDTPERLHALADRLRAAGRFVFDLETTSREAMRAKLVGFAFSDRYGDAFYIPVGHGLYQEPGTMLPMELTVAPSEQRQLSEAEVLAVLAPIFEDPTIEKVAHNAKYDMTVLEEHGVRVRGMTFDTMIAAYVLNESGLSLNDLALTRLNIELQPITELIGQRRSQQILMSQVPAIDAARYAGAQADVTGRLRDLLERDLHEDGLWELFAEVEMPLVPVLVTIERNGVALDTGFLREMSQRLDGQLRALEQQIYDAAGHPFNINSTQQLGKLLFEELGLPSGKRTRTGYSTDASVLDGLRGRHAIVDLILEFRQLIKLKSTYIDALPGLINPKTGRVHTSFNQTVASTGRLSSSDPNLQNIPIRTALGREIRRAFIAGGDGEQNYLLSADYSQIELRILAHVTRDPRMVSAFEQGLDIHASTAALMRGVPIEKVTADDRRLAKTTNFGVIYGISDYGLFIRTELSRAEAQRFIENYFQTYPGIKRYIDTTKAEAFEKGFVHTLLGRRRPTPEVQSSNYQVRQAAERMAVNMPIQGTAADMIKLAMIEIQRQIEERGLRSKMILQVHDELVFEVPEAELETLKPLLHDAMCQAFPLTVPLEVEMKVGRTWAEVEPVRQEVALEALA